MCAIYSLCIILLVYNIYIRNFRCFGWNENFLTFVNYCVYYCHGLLFSRVILLYNFWQFEQQLTSLITSPTADINAVSIIPMPDTD